MKIHWVQVTVFGFIATGTACLSTGCAASAGTSEEEVTAVSEALGDVGCESAHKDDEKDPGGWIQVDPNTQPVCIPGHSSTSTDTGYGSATCPSQWLVGYGAFSDSATATAWWSGPLPTNHDDCVGSRLALATYTLSGTWTIHTALSFGHWSGTSCSFPQPTLSVDAGTWHRVSGVAWRKSGLLSTTAKVSVRLSRC